MLQGTACQIAACSVCCSCSISDGIKAYYCLGNDWYSAVYDLVLLAYAQEVPVHALTATQGVLVQHQAELKEMTTNRLDKDELYLSSAMRTACDSSRS